jgi:hypothetical protein
MNEQVVEVGAYAVARRTISDMQTRLARDSQEHARKARTLRRIRALADEWEADQGIFSPDSRYTRDVMLRELREALGK